MYNKSRSDALEPPQADSVKPVVSTSSLPEALAYIASERTNAVQPAFLTLSYSEFLDMLEFRVKHPEELSQGYGTNFCWLAVILYYAFSVDPAGLSRSACGLFKDGTFKYTNLVGDIVEAIPNDALKKELALKTLANYDISSTDPKCVSFLDMILFTVIASNPNTQGLMQLFNQEYDPGDERDYSVLGGHVPNPWAGRTFPEAVKAWKMFGFSVESAGATSTWIQSDLFGENLIKFADIGAKAHRDVCLFIRSAKMKQATEPVAQSLIGSHFILAHDFGIDCLQVKLTYWDYGHWKPFRGPSEGLISREWLRKVLHGVMLIERPNGCTLRGTP